MTGITRISKESIFSDLNNLEVVTTTSDKYTDSFGFTQEEVMESLRECGLSGMADQVMTWSAIPDNPHSRRLSITSSCVKPKESVYLSEVVVTTSRLFRSEKMDSLLILVIPVMIALSKYGF